MARPAALAAVVSLALVALVVAFAREHGRAGALGDGPEHARARIERCLRCHAGAGDDPGGAHAALAVGCSSCHLGNPAALDKARAHAGLEREPGALQTVALTCGQAGCHPQQAARVQRSPMATAAGIVAVQRAVFGEPAGERPSDMEGVLRLATPTPAEDHTRRLCGGCHLGARKDNRDDAIVGTATGCAACHATPKRQRQDAHPRVDSRVPDSRCQGCHSRSGRISLSWQGLYEVREVDLPACATPARTHDGRAACRLEPDVHQKAALSCIDCHLHTELMGDGQLHARKSGLLEVRCESCHGPAQGLQTTWGALQAPVTRGLLRQRDQSRSPAEAVRTGAHGTPLWNLRPPPVALPSAPPKPSDLPAAATAATAAGPGWTLTLKNTGRPLPVVQTPADPTHTLGGHQRLTCAACHTARTPTCTTCHVRRDPAGQQWDFGRGAPASGAWVETSDGMSWGPPTLAVRAERAIVPATPGMIMTLEPGEGAAVSHHRLFAPLQPHSTGKMARPCLDCHRSPVALGLGSGRLDLAVTPPVFQPGQPVAPGSPLALDGWAPLLPGAVGRSTHADVRSLDHTERLRTLRVALCLPCHREAGDPIYRDFPGALARLAGPRRCPVVLPDWAASPLR